PYLAHAPMEPLNATVRIGRDGCEIWSGTQLHGADQKIAAQMLGLAPEKVTIHTPFLGGGFGRRLGKDFVALAVGGARAAGATVKRVWPREDDIRGGYYRPMFLHRIEAGADAKGQPIAWRHTIVGQGIGDPESNGVYSRSVHGAADSPYLAGIPAHLVTLHSPPVPVPAPPCPSLSTTPTAFPIHTPT